MCFCLWSLFLTVFLYVLVGSLYICFRKGYSTSNGCLSCSWKGQKPWIYTQNATATVALRVYIKHTQQPKIYLCSAFCSSHNVFFLRFLIYGYRNPICLSIVFVPLVFCFFVFLDTVSALLARHKSNLSNLAKWFFLNMFYLVALSYVGLSST